MFENLLYQPASGMLINDLRNGTLPNAILFSGPESSGKLTCALELSRILACRNSPAGQWQCTCPSCLKHKALNTQDVIIAGPGDCTPEINAAAETLLKGTAENAPWRKAALYLFIRSIRKLTMRFSPVLWEDDEKASKAVPYLSTIEELLEELDPQNDLPEEKKMEKTVNSLVKQASALEENLMYDTVPINQIRKATVWARMTVSGSKKVIIFENADKMQDSVRNALLKILEEPPEDTIFILTTSRKGAIIPTILSRVRIYTFIERTVTQQEEIIKRVFHADGKKDGINSFLYDYLPVSSDEIRKTSEEFCSSLLSGKKMDLTELIKKMNGFEPRVLLQKFFEYMFDHLGSYLREESTVERLASRTERSAAILMAVRNTYDNITVYNQSVTSAFEALYERHN